MPASCNLAVPYYLYSTDEKSTLYIGAVPVTIDTQMSGTHAVVQMLNGNDAIVEESRS